MKHTLLFGVDDALTIAIVLINFIIFSWLLIPCQTFVAIAVLLWCGFSLCILGLIRSGIHQCRFSTVTIQPTTIAIQIAPVSVMITKLAHTGLASIQSFSILKLLTLMHGWSHQKHLE